MTKYSAFSLQCNLWSFLVILVPVFSSKDDLSKQSLQQKLCLTKYETHTHTHILYAFSSLVCAQSAWQRLRAILQLGGTQVSGLTLEIALMLPLKHYCSLGTVSPHTGFYSINKTTANFAFDAFYSYLYKSIMITQIREREETSIISLDYVVYWNSFDPHFLHI